MPYTYLCNDEFSVELMNIHYATSRKAAGSRPDEVDYLNLPNPSGRTIALGSTQPLTEMSTRNLKKKLPPSVSRLSKKCGSLDLAQS
jgi:hypothetical protein